ncbi:gliding motility-associated C-terminal domain-containing protein [Hymenobacter sp. B81]|uniref:DUF7948 domain-containing protein n=1 Tax=Hymenobacter sp. B81 TaxID=3344878 RepID=UPI0037DC0F8B
MPTFTPGRLGHFFWSLLLVLTAPAAAWAGAPARSLEFIENRGQWDARARYAALLPAGRLFLEADGFTYTMFDPAAIRRFNEHGHGPDPARDAGPELPAGQLRGHAYSMRFVGARNGVKLLPIEPTGEVRNYLLGNEAKRWASQVGGFRQVQYDGLWPGIDARVYENAQQRLEYDFNLRAGADPKRIRLRYDHAEALRLTPEGSLEISTSVGRITELAPQAWQLDATGRRQPVACRYVLRGREVSFELARYDAKRPLIIDPTVVFSSFTGSTADNWGFTATYDADGNMYSGGVAFGPGYPTSPGAFDTSFGGVTDMAIIKFITTANGPAARAWATYVGGSGSEAPHSMVVNSRNELLILGTTSSGDYPVTQGAFDRSFNGGSRFEPLSGVLYANGSDLVVTALSPNGAGLVASTFLGGSSNDGLLATGSSLVRNYGDQFRGDITVDPDDNVYLVSSTNSGDFPTRSGFDGGYGGATDAVVVKLNPNLNDLQWSSYFGGTGPDAAFSVQVNAAREVYIAGGTTSPVLYNTAGAVIPSLQGGVDGFVARISPDGRSVMRMSYIGTSQYDQAYFLQLDDQGGVYLLGQTKGPMPITPGAVGNLGGKQFIQKLSPGLDALLISTVFGTARSGSDISPTAFLVDQCERIYVCGWGGGANERIDYNNEDVRGMYTTPNALQRTSGGDDFYLIQFTPYAAGVEYATFFGGNAEEHVDGGTSRFDRRGFVYQAVCGGCGGSSSFPFPPHAGNYTTRNGSSNCNNAAFKIDFGIQAAVAGPNQRVCADAAPMRLGGQPAGGTWTGTGVSGSAATGFTFTPTPGLVGQHRLTYSAASTGTCVTTSQLTMTVLPVTPVSFPPVDTRCANDGAVALVASPPGGTFSGPGVQGNLFRPGVAGPGTHTLTYTLPPDQCGVATQQVQVNAPPLVNAGRDTALCSLQRTPYQLTGFSPAGGTWRGPGCTPAGMFTPPLGQSGRITLTYSYTAGNGCTQQDSLYVVLVPANRTNQPLTLPECLVRPRRSENLPQYTGLAPFTHTFDHDLLFASRYEWDFGDGQGSSNEQFPTHTFTKPGTYLVRLTAIYNSTCQASSVFLPVYVGDPFIPNIITPNGDSVNDVFEQRLSCLPVELQVFSKWGNQVFEARDYRNNWGGQGLPDGVYYYHLRDTENRRAKGWLEIRHR